MNDTDLMKQSIATAASYFSAAVREIDDRFGDGYAEKHPELIAAFMRTAAIDFQTVFLTQRLTESLNNIADVLDK